MNSQAAKRLERDNENRDNDGFRPVKNRSRSKKDRQDHGLKGSKFTGLNKDELEGIVICESVGAPTAQQYDALLDALVVYSASRNSKVKTSLRSLEYIAKDEFKPNAPDPSEYTRKDNTIDTALQQTILGIWKDECSVAFKQFSKYKEAIEGLFETIIGQLGKEIINNLKGSQGWKTIDDSNDTIELLKILRELCYRDNNNKVHPVDDLIRKLLRLFQSRQNEKSPSTYVEETTNKSEVLRSVGGEILSPGVIKYTINKVLKGTPSYADYVKFTLSTDSDEKKKKQMVDGSACEVILAHTIIRGSNDKMHQGLRIELEKDFAKGHDNYPMTSTEALELLNRYKIKNGKRSNRKGPKDEKEKNGNRSGQEEESKQLTTIGQACPNQPPSEDEGHGKLEEAHQMLMNSSEDSRSKHDDHDGNDDELIFVQMSVEQYNTRHNDLEQASRFNKNTQHVENRMNSWTSPTLSTQYDNTWPLLEATLYADTENERVVEANENSENYESTDTLYGAHVENTRNVIKTESSSHVNFNESNMTRAFMFAQQHGGMVDPFWILLDSQASCNVICNRRLVKNIRQHPEGNRMTIHCNAGSMVINTVADLAGYGMVWFNEKCIANCLSLALVSDKFRVTLDTSVDQAFMVHKPNGDMRRFHRAECDLYVCDLRERNSNVLVTTVAGEKKNYSRRDIRRAETANKLQESLMFPSDKAVLDMIDRNTIVNCEVTRRDFMLAKKIFGPNPNIIKGKTTRIQPTHVREDHWPIPPAILTNYKNVTIAIDIFTINGVRFFRSISRHLMYRITHPIRDAKESTMKRVMKQIINVYTTRGFKMQQVYGDNEFSCLNDWLQSEYGIHFFPVARGAHEPFIERDGRTSKERCRCVYSSLPFIRWPTRMIMELPMAVDFFLNYWCSSGGVSDTIPPRQILYGIKLNAKVHCKFQFGEYILAHEESDNTMKPRARDAIYLRPTGNPDGGFYVFDLKTARRVHRRNATRAHMTNTIIDRVHEIARKQGAPEGINFGGFDPDVTITDIDTASNAPEDDDDDASDGTYEENSDDETVETEVTGEVESDDESVEDNVMYQPTINPASDNNNPANDNESTVENPEEEENEDPEQGQQTDVVTEDEPDGDPQDEENDAEEPSGSERKRSLRPVVRSKRYDESEGYKQATRTRNVHDGGNFFTAGYSHAVRRLEKDHQKVMLVSAAIELYNNTEASLVTPQYGVKKGLRIFGKAGTEAVLKELKQLNDLNVVTPVHPKRMSQQEIKRALPYLMFLKRKRCGKVKGRGCADGRPQRDFIDKEDASSPTASTTAIMLSCLIDAIEERSVGVVDIPGAFLQCDLDPGDVTHVKLVGAMADLLAKVDPDKYLPHMVTNRKGESVLFTRANKAIYGTLRAALIFWEKLTSFLRSKGFKANPYDRCTYNKMVNGSQATVIFWVDDVKISHSEERVVADIIAELNSEFGKVAELTGKIARVHEYLGMTIDYSDTGVVKFSMIDYLKDIVDNIPEHLKSSRSAATPAADHLFDTNADCKKLGREASEEFHHYVAKLLYAAKRARPDIQTAIAFLCTRVKSPDEDDQKKLIRVIEYVRSTIFLPLTIGWDGTGNIYWFVDASFAVHPDMKSHTGATATFGKGSVLSISTKQKINTKSSTEAELVGVDDALPHNLWCKRFLTAQGYQNGKDKKTGFIGHTNLLYQDNTSSIRMETNGKASCTKRTRHIAIRYFMIVDVLKQKEIDAIEHRPTTEMVGDYFTKPLQGATFRKFRNAIMGVSDAEYIRYKVDYENRK